MTNQGSGAPVDLFSTDKDFTIESGKFFLKQLQVLSSAEGAPEAAVSDWAIVKKWLEGDGASLANTTDEALEIVWEAYVAKGEAPSIRLSEAFRTFAKKYEESDKKLIELPKDLVAVFNRMLATDDELEAMEASRERAKRFAKGFDRFVEIEDEIKKLRAEQKQIAKETGKNYSFPSEAPEKPEAPERKKSRPSKNKRIFILACAVWVLWVLLRTETYFEVMGLEFNEWDEDYIVLNMVSLPGLFLAGYFVKNWLSKPE